MRKSGRRVERLASSEGVGYSAVPDSTAANFGVSCLLDYSLLHLPT